MPNNIFWEPPAKFGKCIQIVSPWDIETKMCDLYRFLIITEYCVCFRLLPVNTLFAGYISPENNTDYADISQQSSQCACKHSEQPDRTISRLNEITTNRFFPAGSSSRLDLKEDLSCSSGSCQDRRGLSVLAEVIQSSQQEDLELFNVDSLELHNSENLVATVKVVGGPVLPRPQAGWTSSEADLFCKEFIQSSEVVQKCAGLPGVEVEASLENCRSDVMVGELFLLPGYRHSIQAEWEF